MTAPNVLIDSSGWIEYFGNGQKAQPFAKFIKKHAGQSIISSPIIIYEVFRRVKITFGEAKASKAVAYIISNAVIKDLDSRTALDAAKTSITNNLPMADSMIYSTAKLNNATLITSDTHFKGMKGAQII